MEYGMPTMVEMQSVEQGAALCRELGLDFLELNTNFPQYSLPKLWENAAELEEIQEKYGIFYTLHLDDEMSAADFNPYVAQASRDTLRDAAPPAKRLGIRRLNMHLSRGAKYTLPDRVIYFFEAYEADYLSQIQAFRDCCQEAIGDSGVQICVENTAGYLDFQKKAAALLLESPAFALTFDIGHNYCSGNMDEDWILEHSRHLRHFHVHDAMGRTQDHRALGTGELDIRRYLAIARDLGCTVVLETKTFQSLRQSVDWLRAQGEFTER